MKKLLAFTLILTLLGVTLTPALAAGGPPTGSGRGSGDGTGTGSKAPFALAGTITGIDPAAQTVTIRVSCGNTLVKPYIGQAVTIQISKTTAILLRHASGKATPITFADLAAGQKVSANGQFANNTWTAARITVGADLTCQP